MNQMRDLGPLTYQATTTNKQGSTTQLQTDNLLVLDTLMYLAYFILTVMHMNLNRCPFYLYLESPPPSIVDTEL